MSWDNYFLTLGLVMALIFFGFLLAFMLDDYSKLVRDIFYLVNYLLSFV